MLAGDHGAPPLRAPERPPRAIAGKACARAAGRPLAAVARPAIERHAIAQRLRVRGAQLATEATARNGGLTHTTRFINVLELGLARYSSNEAPVQTGQEVSRRWCPAPAAPTTRW